MIQNSIKVRFRSFLISSGLTGLGDTMSCFTCGKKFERNFELLEHEKRRCKNKVCKNCGSVFKEVRDLNRHQKSKKEIVCNCCQKTFCNSDHH